MLSLDGAFVKARGSVWEISGNRVKGVGKMKYLLLVKPRAGGGQVPPADVIRVLEGNKVYLNEKLADGTFDCTYGFIDGSSGMAIINADSHEQAMNVLMAYPAWPFLNFEIHPLCDFEQFLDANIEILKRFGG